MRALHFFVLLLPKAKNLKLENPNHRIKVSPLLTKGSRWPFLAAASMSGLDNRSPVHFASHADIAPPPAVGTKPDTKCRKGKNNPFSLFFCVFNISLFLVGYVIS
jgi:hypothetical protein